MSPEPRLKKRYAPVGASSDEERIGMVKEIFSTITGRYDFLNHFLSLRRDIAWRRYACRRMDLSGRPRVLDVATGTADLAIETVRRSAAATVIGVDLVPGMMSVGRRKVEAAGLSDRIFFAAGDGVRLPFPDDSFDAVGIAFGIRNIPDRLGALREMRRVAKPGGQVLVLEMTTPTAPLLRGLYSFYLKRVLPLVARFFSRNPGAYHYLADSIMGFPGPSRFAGIMEEAGLESVDRHLLTFGITCLHTGRKGAGDEVRRPRGAGVPENTGADTPHHLPGACLCCESDVSGLDSPAAM